MRNELENIIDNIHELINTKNKTIRPVWLSVLYTCVAMWCVFYHPNVSLFSCSTVQTTGQRVLQDISALSHFCWITAAASSLTLCNCEIILYCSCQFQATVAQGHRSSWGGGGYRDGPEPQVGGKTPAYIARQCGHNIMKAHTYNLIRANTMFLTQTLPFLN